MTLEQLAEHCLAKKMVTEEMPFDDTVLVYKVAGKMFALANSVTRDFVNLKADPDDAVEMRARYETITPGYHMNKKHWVTVKLDGPYDDGELVKWIDDSYDLVVASLTKKLQREIAEA